MSKNFPKFPSGPDLGYFVVFGIDDWTVMESEDVYAHPLPHNVREQLGLATLFMTLNLPVEVSAPRLTLKTEERLGQIKSQAEKLRTLMFSAHNWLPEYRGDHAQSLGMQLGMQLDEIGGTEADDVELLMFSLNAVIAATDRVLKKMWPSPAVSKMKSTTPKRGYHDGQSWKIWVALVNMIMESNRLPCGYRKDPYTSRKNEDEFIPPPFVRLIKHIQKIAVRGYKRSSTDGGLAKAIDRAIEHIDLPHIKAKKVNGYLLSVLGATNRDVGRWDKLTAMDYMIDTVLQGRQAGVHPIVPEPLYYSAERPQPTCA